jgi:hypothetical protein
LALLNNGQVGSAISRVFVKLQALVGENTLIIIIRGMIDILSLFELAEEDIKTSMT